MYSLAFGDACYLLKFPLSLPHPQGLCIAFITCRLNSFAVHSKKENTFPESTCLDFVLLQDSTFVWLLNSQKWHHYPVLPMPSGISESDLECNCQRSLVTLLVSEQVPAVFHTSPKLDRHVQLTDPGPFICSDLLIIVLWAVCTYVLVSYNHPPKKTILLFLFEWAFAFKVMVTLFHCNWYQCTGNHFCSFQNRFPF